MLRGYAFSARTASPLVLFNLHRRLANPEKPAHVTQELGIAD
jgi:hypothetical protein